MNTLYNTENALFSRDVCNYEVIVEEQSAGDIFKTKSFFFDCNKTSTTKIEEDGTAIFSFESPIYYVELQDILMNKGKVIEIIQYRTCRNLNGIEKEIKHILKHPKFTMKKTEYSSGDGFCWTITASK